MPAESDRGGHRGADEAGLAVRRADHRARCMTSALIWHHAFDCAPPPATRTSRIVVPRTRRRRARECRASPWPRLPAPPRGSRRRRARATSPSNAPRTSARQSGARSPGKIGQEQRPIQRPASCLPARSTAAASEPRTRNVRWHHDAQSAPACVGPPIWQVVLAPAQRHEARHRGARGRDQPRHFRRARDVVALAGAYRARAHRRRPRIHRAGEHRNSGEAAERRLPARHRSEPLPRRASAAARGGGRQRSSQSGSGRPVARRES